MTKVRKRDRLRVRRKPGRKTAAALAAGAFGTSAHQAAGSPMVYPNQRLVNDPVLNALHTKAQKFWSRRGVEGTPSKLYVADNVSSHDDTWPIYAVANGPSNGYAEPAIIMDGDMVGADLARLKSKYRQKQRRALRELYTTMTHEEGHARGLSHNVTKQGGAHRVMTEMGNGPPSNWRKVMKQMRREGLIAPPTKSEIHRRRGGVVVGRSEG